MATTTHHHAEILVNGEPLARDEAYFDDDAPDAFCFVCGRCTDHFAEHDDLVDAGMAVYGAHGSVLWADTVDAGDIERLEAFEAFRWAIIGWLHPEWYKAR